MNIKQASAASGLTADTIRFYERRRIVPAPGRRSNGYRDYTERHVAALSLARGLRDLGIPLADIASIVRLAHDGTCPEVRDAMTDLADETLRRLDDRLRMLRATRRDLKVLRAGLARVHVRQRTIPGVTPCECVSLVVRRRNHPGVSRPAGRRPAR